MTKKFRKHTRKQPLFFQKPAKKEILKQFNREVPLNINNSDKIIFTLLRDSQGNIREIVSICYVLFIDKRWVTIVRYDDHAGKGIFHRHTRTSLQDGREIETSENVELRGNKNKLFQWAFDDIHENYLVYRKNFFKNSSITDLY